MDILIVIMRDKTTSCTNIFSPKKKKTYFQSLKLLNTIFMFFGTVGCIMKYFDYVFHYVFKNSDLLC